MKLVLQGYPHAMPQASQPLDFSCPIALGNEYETVGRHSSSGLTGFTSPGDKLQTMKEMCFCSPSRRMQLISIASMRAELLMGKADGSVLWKNIQSIKSFTQNTSYLDWPDSNYQMNEWTRLFVFLSVKKWKKKKSLWRSQPQRLHL